MDWCGHCSKPRETRITRIPNASLENVCSWCSSCGKVLSDTSTIEVETLIPRMRKTESYQRIKRVRKFKLGKKDAGVEAEWCDHCVKYPQTVLSSIPDPSPEIFSCWCISCGRVMWNMGIELDNNFKEEEEQKCLSF